MLCSAPCCCICSRSKRSAGFTWLSCDEAELSGGWELNQGEEILLDFLKMTFYLCFRTVNVTVFYPLYMQWSFSLIILTYFTPVTCNFWKFPSGKHFVRLKPWNALSSFPGAICVRAEGGIFSSWLAGKTLFIEIKMTEKNRFNLIVCYMDYRSRIALW